MEKQITVGFNGGYVLGWFILVFAIALIAYSIFAWRSWNNNLSTAMSAVIIGCGAMMIGITTIGAIKGLSEPKYDASNKENVSGLIDKNLKISIETIDFTSSKKTETTVFNLRDQSTFKIDKTTNAGENLLAMQPEIKKALGDQSLKDARITYSNRIVDGDKYVLSADIVGKNAHVIVTNHVHKGQHEIKTAKVD